MDYCVRLTAHFIRAGGNSPPPASRLLICETHVKIFFAMTLLNSNFSSVERCLTQKVCKIIVACLVKPHSEHLKRSHIDEYSRQPFALKYSTRVPYNKVIQIPAKQASLQ